MMQITVIDNQCLLDIAMQATGKAENFLKIAQVNNLIPTVKLVPGTVILIPESMEKNDEVVRYYLENDIVPATALNELTTITELTCEEKLYECFKD